MKDFVVREGLREMKPMTVLLCMLWATLVQSQILNETCVDLLFEPVFNELTTVYGISNGSGLCHVAVQDVINEEPIDTVCTTCQPVVELCSNLVGRLNQTVQSECLLIEASPYCSHAPHSYKAYGYGAAMLAAVLVLATSLSFVCAKLGQRLKGKHCGEEKGGLTYKLLNLSLTALGASALMDNAVLHIVPQVLDINASDTILLTKGCVLLVGLYAFYFLEFVLHSFTGHSHSHGGNEGEGGHDDHHCEVTLPHGACKDDGPGSTIVHPRRGRDEDCTQHNYDSVPRDERKSEEDAHFDGEKGDNESVFGADVDVDGKEKPILNSDVDSHLASGHGHSHGGGDKGGGSTFLLLMVADTLHVLADGVALGASISQSLTLGLATSIALLLHELPHMFGDFNILLRLQGGIVRKVFPFLIWMYLVAFVGYFAGASVGLNCAEANKWILSLVAGFFFYVALVDLLPELIDGVPRGKIRLLASVVIGFSFLLTFAIFILLVLYQNSINVAL